jgi:uncharacterized protein
MRPALLNLFEDDPIAVAVLGAIRAGDLESLRLRLRETPELATARLTRRARGAQPVYSYPLIGAATDWPGHFARVSDTIALLVAAGADVDAHAAGPHAETPLHGAASTDDIAALDALLDAGANIDAPGAVIAGGTPLDDAVAFAQWRAARRLVERGASAAVWHAAALGLLDRLEQFFASGLPPAAFPWGGAEGATAAGACNIAFWCACHGGQRTAAERLLGRGAVLDWVSPWDGLSPLDAARRSGADRVAEWLVSIGARPARNGG